VQAVQSACENRRHKKCTASKWSENEEFSRGTISNGKKAKEVCAACAAKIKQLHLPEENIGAGSHGLENFFVCDSEQLL